MNVDSLELISRRSILQQTKKFLQKNASDKTHSMLLEKALRDLWLQAKEMTNGEETVELIDDLTVFIMKLFLRQKLVSSRNLAQLKTFFGDVSNKSAQHVCQVTLIASFSQPATHTYSLFRLSAQSLRVYPIMCLTN